MTAIKSTHEFRTALDINTTALTKNQLHKILTETAFPASELKRDRPTYFIHNINVGQYTIQLEFFSYERIDSKDDLKIRIFTNNLGKPKEINLVRDEVFKLNEWVKRNAQNKLSFNDLIDAVMFCMRIERICAFN